MDKIYFSVSFGGTAIFSVLGKVKSVSTIVSSYYAMEALMQWEGFCCFRKYCHKMKHLSLPLSYLSAPEKAPHSAQSFPLSSSSLGETKNRGRNGLTHHTPSE